MAQITFVGILLMLFAVVSPVNATDFATADARFQALTSDQDKMIWVEQYEPEIGQWPVLDQAYFYHRKGLALEVNDDINGAIEQFNHAIELFKSLNEIDPGLVTSLLDLAYMKYLQSNDTKVYCPDRKEAVAVARKIDHPEALAGSLVQLAFCYQNGFDELSQGLAVLTEAAEVVQKNNLSHSQLAMIYNATGNLYRANQVHQPAYEYYQKAHQLWLNMDDTQDVFNMLHNMANEAVELGHWQLAESHVNDLFNMADKHTDFSDFEFFAEFNAGRLAIAQKDFKQAVAGFEAALALRDTTPEQYFIKVAESQLAIAHFRLGQYDQAFQAADNYLADIADINADTTAQQAVIIQLYAQQKTEQALQKLWELFDKTEANKRLFVKNAVALQSLSFSETIDALQNQASQHQLAINELLLKQQQKQTRINQLTAIVVGLFALVAIVIAWFLYRAKKHYQIRAQTDYLTHIANRRHIIQEGRRLLQHCQQRRLNFSIIIIDIDDFKPINDDYGHAVGDVVIQQVVKSMCAGLNDDQMLGRIGGEEFLLLLPNVNKGRAHGIAETIRQQVAETMILVENVQLKITVSLGVASNQPPVATFEKLLRRADEAMYQAKTGGKNQVQPTHPVAKSL